jgi:NTP pyrophosphatase (non-canonical NTP hydrolase)
MNPNQYTKEAALTDHDTYEQVTARLNDDKIARLVHYGFGLGSEVGEFQDALKKYIAYGKPIDVVNLKEEIGDLLWYLSRICETCEFTLEDAMETNIAKLKARYGEKWTQEAALNRNLKLEREILEKRGDK